jgi:hypothetical protein
LYELEDKALAIAPPFDEVIPIFEVLAQEEVSTVSCFPLQDFDDALFYDLGRKEVLKDPLVALTPSCYDEENNLVNNIDEFIHVGRRKWDIIGYDMDPTYDIENNFHVFPIHLSQQVTPNPKIWQHGDDIITNTFQTPRDDLVLYSPDDFRSYLEDFGEYSFDHSDLFYEKNYQPLLCSNIDKSEEVTYMKQDTCDNIFHLPSITLPRYVTEGMVWKNVPYPNYSVRQSLPLELRGRLSTLVRSLLSQSSNLPLRNCQSSYRLFLVTIPF